MNNLELQEAPIFPINRLKLANPPDPKSQRITIAAAVIGVLALFAIDIQLYGLLTQQKTDMATMGDKIQQLEQDNHDLKNKIEDQANSAIAISSELDSTKTKLESTRQDLGNTQSDLEDTRKELTDTKSALDSIKTEFQDSREEMAALKQNYSSAMAGFVKKDEDYSNDIRVILQKIQSLDIENINDKIYELQMSMMNLEKKIMDSGKTPFVEDTQKVHLTSPAQN